MPETVSSAQSLWLAQNQRYLMASIAGVYAALLHKDGAPADTPAGQGMPPGALEQEIAASQAALSAPAALDVLGHRLALSPFERATLLACAGLELDAKFSVEFDPAGSKPLCFARLLSTLPVSVSVVVGPGTIFPKCCVQPTVIRTDQTISSVEWAFGS